MTIKVGDKLPEATFLLMGEDGPEEVSLKSYTEGKTVLLFAVPGAFTPTCTHSHLPGYINNASAFYDKGVDAILCVTVNDVFVAQAWAQMVGADKNEVTVLADPTSEFTKAMGVAFDGPPVGLYGRSKRYALLAKDGEVTAFELEDNPGVCELSSAESMLDKL